MSACVAHWQHAAMLLQVGNGVECYGLKVRRHNSRLQSKERLISWCHWSTRSCKLKGSSCIISTTPSYPTYQVAIQSDSDWRWPELGTLTQSCIGWFLHTSSQLNRLRCWYRRWKNRALSLLGGRPTLYPTVLPFDYNYINVAGGSVGSTLMILVQHTTHVVDWWVTVERAIRRRSQHILMVLRRCCSNWVVFGHLVNLGKTTKWWLKRHSLRV